MEEEIKIENNPVKKDEVLTHAKIWLGVTLVFDIIYVISLIALGIFLSDHYFRILIVMSVYLIIKIGCRYRIETSVKLILFYIGWEVLFTIAMTVSMCMQISKINHKYKEYTPGLMILSRNILFMLIFYVGINV